MVEFANVVNLFENTLERPLDRKELEKNPLTPKDLQALAVESRELHNAKILPEKGEFEVRPFIDPEFNMGVMDYAVGGNLSNTFSDFVFDDSVSGRMTSNIKRLLLYSHSVVINDPLDYILDFFYLNQESTLPPYILGRVDAANSLLKEFSDMAELIREKILITTPFTVMNDGKIPYLDEASEQSIVEALADKVSTKELSRYEYLVRSLIARHNSFEGNADYFFPESKYVYILVEILRALGREFVSEQTKFQLNASLLARLNTIDVDSLGVRDIVSIRTNDEIFEGWRGFLGQALKETASNEKITGCLDAEFNDFVRRELESKNNEVVRRVVGSKWGRELGGSIFDIGIGAISGAIPGSFIGNDGGLSGAVSGASRDVLKALYKLYSSMRDRKANGALRSHFVTLGANRNT